MAPTDHRPTGAGSHTSPVPPEAAGDFSPSVASTTTTSCAGCGSALAQDEIAYTLAEGLRRDYCDPCVASAVRGYWT